LRGASDDRQDGSLLLRSLTDNWLPQSINTQVVDTIMYIYGGAPPDAHPQDLYSFSFGKRAAQCGMTSVAPLV
jgi:hypothetical protein